VRPLSIPTPTPPHPQHPHPYIPSPTDRGAGSRRQIRGTDVVGSASLAFTVASLGPFLLIIFLGITQLDVVEVVQVRVCSALPSPPLHPQTLSSTSLQRWKSCS
jgi:hypothetical protein